MLGNPHHYYYQIGEIAVLTCICEDGTLDPLDPMPVVGRTINIKIRRHSDDKFLNFATGLWESSPATSEFEQVLTDNNDGTYYWEFDQVLYTTGAEIYTVTYIDNSDTYTGTTLWGGTDYDILTYAIASFIPNNPTDPLKVNIYGWLLDDEGAPMVSKNVTAILDRDGQTYLPTSGAVQKTLILTTTDANGYWELEMLPTEQLGPEECMYIFTFNKRDVYEVYVPETPSTVHFQDLRIQPRVYPI